MQVISYDISSLLLWKNRRLNFDTKSKGMEPDLIGAISISMFRLKLKILF